MVISEWVLSVVFLSVLFFGLAGEGMAAHHEEEGVFAKAQPWGYATKEGTNVLLHVKKWGEGGVISIPRLNNVVPTIELKGVKGKVGLKPKPDRWEIVAPKGFVAKGVTTVVMAVEGEVYEPIEPRVVVAGADGDFVLYSHDAVVHGEKICYEPLPHKNVVGFWVNASDWAEWHVRVAEAGKYRMEIRQGCGGSGGSDVKVSLGESSLNFKVKATGGFQVFEDRDLGLLEVKKGGVFRLQVKPQVKEGNAVMDIRQIVLKKVK